MKVCFNRVTHTHLLLSLSLSSTSYLSTLSKDESGNFLQPDTARHTTNDAAIVGHNNTNNKVNDLHQLQLTLSNQYPKETIEIESAAEHNAILHNNQPTG